MNVINTDTSHYADASAHPASALGGLVSRLRNDRGLLRRVLMIGGVAIVAVVSLVMYLTGGRYVSTDDAYVQAAKLMVTTDVSGMVKEIDVKEGQYVKTGQVLFRLDPLPFQIALNNAKAQLGQVDQTIQSTKDDYLQALRNVDAQKAQVDLDQRNFQRYAALLKVNAIAASTYDQARLTLATAQQQVLSLQQTADSTLAKLNGNPNIAPEKTPQYQQALATVAEDERQLSHATVRAPFDGIVTEVDSLQPGTLVISALSAFTTTSAVGLVGTQNVWVEAHMKETDLTHVHNGDPVEISIDTFPGHTWHGHIMDVSAATGSAFSVLPSENASGNWVKVVQRIPTKIAIDRKPGDPVLSSGMSAVVEIDTHHRRWWRLLHDM
ncbi:MAG: HlyD family secretion protein [Rhizomicrobium sp.]|jgi:membrane fusion protein (multidrug efflux system)